MELYDKGAAMLRYCYCILYIFGLQFQLTTSLNPAWWSSVAQLSAHLPSRPLCTALPGLSKGQARMCELFMDHMPAIGHGARQAIQECQSQFKVRRWNCSSNHMDVFGPVHALASREAAYTYAIVSAGVTHEISRSCRNGLLSTCGCGADRRPDSLHKEWLWGGCGDNIAYGYNFAQDFIDIRERERRPNKRSIEYGRSLMNRWNNEVGRKLIKRNSKVHCKCHGVSGSCNLKTCWKQLATLNEVASELVDKYEDAIKVKLNKRGNLQLIRRSRHKRASKVDLVYLDDSPDYCKSDPLLGISGTSGRECQLARGVIDSCDLLCCGRGYNTYSMSVTEKCHCKFQWCCRVVCKTCRTQVTVHRCK